MSIAIQQSLFPEMPEKNEALKSVNVSSVPLRSPFRYPGGKTWFVPTFRRWFANCYPHPSLLIEPFAGGGIISLTALFENFVPNVVMAEIDEDVAAVWQVIVDGQAAWLGKRILSFNLTRENVVYALGQQTSDLRERAFKTILKNRTCHGGILADGAGLIKHGESGKGITSRWYPGTLSKRLTHLDYIADRIKFCKTDGIKILEEYSSRKDTIFFIDPPYTAGGKNAGKRLYRHSKLDHEKLFSLCQSLKGDFLMTYDNADEVREMACRYGFAMRLIPMTNTHNTSMNELVIGRNLSWMDEFSAVSEPTEPYGK
jgi:DNA adenine methylase